MNTPSKILIVGSYGQLGRELDRALRSAGCEVAGCDRDTIDISEAGAAEKALESFAPVAVVNAAAYTAVDKAETEPEQAYAANVRGSRFLAEACNRHDVPLIHISTDYVFDGTKGEAYRETDPTNPLSVYGRTKREGEIAIERTWARHVILRTAWLYSQWGNNFAKTMLRLAQERPVVRVVADQYGTPTSAADLADAIAAIVPQITSPSAPYGIYHAANSGLATWHEFAAAIFADLERRGGKHVTLEAISTTDYPTPARRPQFSHLDCSRLAQVFGVTMRPWQNALKHVLDGLHTASEMRAP